MNETVFEQMFLEPDSTLNLYFSAYTLCPPPWGRVGVEQGTGAVSGMCPECLVWPDGCLTAFV